MAKILVVEDDPEYAEIVADWLKMEHHLVEVSTDGRDAFELVTINKFDLVILDWQIPSLSGIELCQQLRSRGVNVPIIMLTGKNQSVQKQEGLNTGADDYMTKPADLPELSARVRALIRRSTKQVSHVLTIRDLVVDTAAHTVSRQGTSIDLYPREFALLEFLLRHRKRVFSGEELLDRVWASDVDSSMQAVRACVNRLRRKIEQANEPPIIKTTYSVGYSIDE